MGKRRVDGRSGTVRRAAVFALLAGALLTPSDAAAFLLPDPYSYAAAGLPCPPKSERGDTFPAPTRTGVRDLIEEFVADYNAGELAKLNGHFAAAEDFRWYFVEGERKHDSTQRHTLLAYFATRHALEDRLRIVDLDIGREPGWHGGYDFSVRLNRRSDEARARGMWHGKGAADCAIFVWSLGRD